MNIIPTVIIRKNAAKRPEAVAQIVRSLALGTAVEMNIAIRQRVTKGAGTVTKGAPYSTTSGKSVSPRYPERGAGGKQTRGGAIWYPSIAQLHATTRPNSYDVSQNGLWSGLAEEVSSPYVVLQAFRGRSEGQGMAFAQKINRGGVRVFKKRKGAHARKLNSKRAFKARKQLITRGSEEPYFGPDGKAVPRKVSNATKAGAVMATKGVHLLEMNNDEWKSIAAGAASSVMQAARLQSDNEIVETARINRSALAAAIARRIGLR